MGRHKLLTNRCGTHAGWQAHQNEKTRPCQPCKDARNAYKRDLHAKDPEKKRDQNKNYKKKYPEKNREKNRRRRARLRNGIVSRYKENKVIAEYGPYCWLCGGRIDLKAPRTCKGKNWEKGLHIDHVIPIALGGSDTIENVRPAHAICNEIGRAHV